jgi:hypothetical protein
MKVICSKFLYAATRRIRRHELIKKLCTSGSSVSEDGVYPQEYFNSKYFRLYGKLQSREHNIININFVTKDKFE